MKRSSTRSSRRRWLGYAGLAAVLVLGGFVGFVADLARPRHDHFGERIGALVNSETEIIRGDEREGLVDEYVTIRSTTGLKVSFRVLRPDLGSRHVPTILLLAGHTTGRDAVDLVGDPGNIAVVAMDYPYQGPAKIRGVWQGINAIPKIRQGLLDTPPAVSLVLDWLLTQRWFDPDQAELLGGSIGVPFAAVAGAIDGRFLRVWLVHGGADNREWLFGVLREDISNETLRRCAASLLHLIAHGASFNTGYWIGEIAPRPVVVIGAKDDESLTPENIQALHDAAKEPRKIIWTTGGHVTRGNTEVIRQILDIVRAEMGVEMISRDQGRALQE